MPLFNLFSEEMVVLFDFIFVRRSRVGVRLKKSNNRILKIFDLVPYFDCSFRARARNENLSLTGI